MSSLFRFRVFCHTENKYVETWASVQPEVCPNVNTHAIDQESWTVLQEVSERIVEIKEERIPTGGNYKYYSREVIIPSGIGITTSDFKWDYPVSILNGVVTVRDENVGDILEVIAAPDTIIGNITAPVDIGDTVISVSQTVTDTLMLGYQANLLDGSNSNVNDIGEIVNINKTNGTITINKPTTSAFSQLSPTYVRMNVPRLETVHLAYPGRFNVGENRIGGTYLPVGLIFQVRYHNKDGQAKKFYTAVEILY